VWERRKASRNSGRLRPWNSVRKTAVRLGVHRNTAFRLRHLMLPKLERHQPSQLSGVAEIDEAFFRESYKGRKRATPRAPYSRGTPAKKRGISSEQIPVLTAVCRGTRSSHITVLPPVPTTKTVAAAHSAPSSPTIRSFARTLPRSTRRSAMTLVLSLPRCCHQEPCRLSSLVSLFRPARRRWASTAVSARRSGYVCFYPNGMTTAFHPCPAIGNAHRLVLKRNIVKCLRSIECGCN